MSKLNARDLALVTVLCLKTPPPHQPCLRVWFCWGFFNFSQPESILPQLQELSFATNFAPGVQHWSDDLTKLKGKRIRIVAYMGKGLWEDRSTWEVKELLVHNT